MDSTTLFDIEQRLSKEYARTNFGTFPTPVAKLSLPELANGPEVWVKHDNFSSDIYGGNKARKLEFMLQKNEKPVITFGPLGSHHVYSTALHAASLGRRCAAVLVPQRMNKHHWEIHEAIMEHCDPVFTLGPNPLPLFALLREYLWNLVRGPQRYQICPPGGTCPLGTLGYVVAGLELATQIQAGDLPEPQKVFVPLGTGGTAVGLALGFAVAGLETEVVAVRVVPKLALPAFALGRLKRQTAKLIAKAWPEFSPKTPVHFRIENGFFKGYAHPTPEAEHAIVQGKKAGIALETTYSAKAMAALIATAKQEPQEPGPYLFWQTFADIPK